MNFIRLILVLMSLMVMVLHSQQPFPAGNGEGEAVGAGMDSGVVREVWLTEGNASLRDFDDLVGWRKAPDSEGKLPTMGFEEDTPGTAITKLTAWFEAPATGDVFFWVASRGAAKLVISRA